MNLGISTACFYPTVTEKAFECCIKSGSECCEVFFNAYSELSPGFLKELKTQAALSGVSIVSVHPFTSIDEPYLLFPVMSVGLRTDGIFTSDIMRPQICSVPIFL